MNVIAIGSDRSLDNPGSESAKRQVAYGTRLGDLRIIVFSLEKQRLKTYALSVETHVYPTASSFRTLYGWSAFWIARKLPKPNVVTVQDPFETGLIGWIIARYRKAAFHVQVHTDFLTPAFRRFSVINRLRFMLAAFVIRRADRIRVVSSRIKEEIEKKYAPECPVTVLPIFVDLQRFRSARPGALTGRFAKFSTRLLVVSRLEPEKNIRLALESFAKLPPETCLIILGDGSERKKLEQWAAEHGVSPRVFFEGRQDPAPYYAVTDLVIVPSHFEGYGRVIIEALAAGKPVLATDVGVAREAGAVVVLQDDFAEALQSALDGPRTGTLAGYPYESFEAYADAYAVDLAGTRESLQEH